MVWGVIFPPSFGDHSPQSNLDAFEQQLSSYFENLSLEEQVRETGVEYSWFPAYTNYVNAKFREAPDHVTPRGIALSPIKDHEWPTILALEKRRNRLTAIIESGTHVLFVAEAFKNIIERLDPGVHQFRPVTITMPRGAVYPEQYYTMVIGRWLESFVPEKSNPECYKRTGEWDFRYFLKFPGTKSQMAGLALTAALFGNAHLWCERKLLKPQICMSNILHDEIIAAGLRLPPHFQMKEV
jgi:hypothetical protein